MKKPASATDYLEQITAAVTYISEQHPFIPEVGIILGTGLGQLIDKIEVEASLSYKDIPCFPISTVETHAGELVLGTLHGVPIVAMKGRFHYYEGYDMKAVTFPVRVMRQLGIKQLIVSNAAGGLDPAFEVGDVMLINDHIDLFPENPLRGKNLDDFGVRFPDMSEPYDQGWLEAAVRVAKQEGIKVHQGVYAGVQGPNLETKAEYRYLRTIGADAVGMSTVPEVIVARQMELPVLAMSAITDLCSPGKVKKISIQEVIAAAAIAEPKMTRIIASLIRQWSDH
ncbi:purine-nucleoside phosphorylase [Echinicola vietnamensis]|uniref:Purine nucleoside phosphorylase n=1 Tax=Echinicola vietnamensis (strain DSM 17526 / LMG 23754 / KMM 6221) TaxID=926556 RepID=L0FVB6_ECHVK|nr:purine-nucleoside phosphorylase [Echinicola vietnamensis]AGA76595.1 purine nucleoside phosphorylase I, inosine and guanosine-specific [Echinicola vietnamensis DSM 17526]